MENKVLCLFDVDGTLTLPRKVIGKQIEEFLKNKLKPKCSMGIVGGSDLKKISEQLGGQEALSIFDYVFAENGLVAYRKDKLIGQQSIQNYLGENKIQELINFCLYFLSQITLPVKRGTFIEFRTGLINVSPVGRSCSQEERENFEKYDKENKIRESLIKALENKFPDWPLKYSIGGQISIDVFPTGWDKTYCLQYLKEFSVVHFFGDKTFEGGNDFEIYNSNDVIGHSVKNPIDTVNQLSELFKI